MANQPLNLNLNNYPKSDLLSIREARDILHSKDWMEFENNFEEGWYGNHIPIIQLMAVNQDKHHIVSAMVARELSKKYSNELDFWDKNPYEKGEKIIADLYTDIAKKHFPEEHIYWGDNLKDLGDFCSLCKC